MSTIRIVSWLGTETPTYPEGDCLVLTRWLIIHRALVPRTIAPERFRMLETMMSDPECPDGIIRDFFDEYA